MRIFYSLCLTVLLLSQAGFVHAREVIVGFEKGTTAAQRDLALTLLGVRFIEALPEIDAVVAEMPDFTMNMDDLRTLALITPKVGDVEENIYRNWLNASMPSFQGMPLPNLPAIMDAVPRFQKAAREPVLPPGVSKKELPWGILRVNAPAAWAKTKGRGVKVAVVDTGIDASHPDIKPNYAGCYNARGGTSCRDGSKHGTHVAGTIAGALDGKGVAGVAPQARLYAVKVLDDNGNGGLVSIIKGLIWCGKNKMDVANLSLGAPIGTVFMRAAVKYAVWKGVTVVAAAGNNGGRINCPACYPDSIAVSASDSSDKLADFSSRGSQVDFIAPGVGIKSSVPGGKHRWFSGTSMASPHVAGLAALAVSRGAKGPEAVRRSLNRAAKSIGLKSKEEGRGMIDAARIAR